MTRRKPLLGSSVSADDLLPIALAVAVPLLIEELRGYTPEDRMDLGHRAGDFVAQHGDDALYRGHKKGDTAKAFGAVARGLAVAAYQPGGVTLKTGQHWCTDHDLCTAAEARAEARAGEERASAASEPAARTYQGRPVTTIRTPVQAALFGSEEAAVPP